MAKVSGAKKTGGRKKGTPNKKTISLMELLEVHDIDVVAQLAETLLKLGPEKKADVLLNLMSYVFPRRKAIELTGSDERAGGPQVIVTLPSNGYEAPGY